MPVASLREGSFDYVERRKITAIGKEIPRVLPFNRAFSINLNFLTGPLPKWLLFHPYLAEWNPGQMIFNQQEKGKTSDGVTVGFDGVGQSPYDFDYTYYYGNKQPAATTENRAAMRKTIMQPGMRALLIRSITTVM